MRVQADGDTRQLAAESEAERRIRDALRGLRFGSVEITVHDSRIVQIERREKVRLDDR